jgi:hypothetical protein
VSSAGKISLPKKRHSRPARPGQPSPQGGERGSVRARDVLGSEIAEPNAPLYEDDRDAVRAMGQVVDAIGANLDRSASALARLEAKLARA